MNALAIKIDDREAFFSLPISVQHLTERTIEALKRMDEAVHGDGLVRQAEAEAAAAGHERGFSRVSLIRKYYRWKDANCDWRVVVDKVRGRASGRGTRLPPEFVEFWRGLCEQNQRATKPAWRALQRKWRDRSEAIPGYGFRRPQSHDLPEGWTYSNLCRFKPTKFELLARRQGRSSAAVARPLVFTTRVGLQVGSAYMFDDLEHDLKVNLLGVNKVALRPLELACLDVFSGSKFAWMMKPMMIGDDGAKIKIRDREMKYLVAHVLC